MRTRNGGNHRALCVGLVRRVGSPKFRPSASFFSPAIEIDILGYGHCEQISR
jgi:hypothetical protein